MTLDNCGDSALSLDACESGLMLQCRGDLDIRHANVLRKVALDALSAGGDVTVDCSELERLDLAALQVLLSLRKSLRAAGRGFRLSICGEAVARYLALAGVDDELAGGAAHGPNCPDR